MLQGDGPESQVRRGTHCWREIDLNYRSHVSDTTRRPLFTLPAITFRDSSACVQLAESGITSKVSIRDELSTTAPTTIFRGRWAVHPVPAGQGATPGAVRIDVFPRDSAVLTKLAFDAGRPTHPQRLKDPRQTGPTVFTPPADGTPSPTR